MAVESFLSNAPLSLSEIVSAIRTQSLDDKAKPVFNDSEIKLALMQAIHNASGKFFLSSTYSLSYTAGTLSYSLPAYIQRITLITRAPAAMESSSENTISGTSAGHLLHQYRHLKTVGGNTLVFTRDYPTSTMTIWYERDVPTPIDDRHAAASHTAAATTLSLRDSDPQLYQLALPAYFKWDKEIVLATAFSGNTSLTITRGQLNTTAASHASGSEVSQIVTADSPRFYSFLFQEAGRLLNEFRVQAGTQNVSVAANITAARMFKDNRTAVLEEIPQTKQPRSMKFRRDRRPRRVF
jgi:hypothetical protein